MADCKVLFILTSATKIPEADKETGFHFEEMSTPYYVLTDAGCTVDIASVAGGKPTADPKSVENLDEQAESVQRFHRDQAAMKKLENSYIAGDMVPEHYDAVYIPGGHGCMFDLPDAQNVIRVIEGFVRAEKPVASVCHGPAALVNVKKPNGEPLVKGRRVNCFTDAEERQVGLADAMPFLLESRLRELGAKFEASGKFQPHVAEDGNLITGQNPASAKPLAEALLKVLKTSANAPLKKSA